jgi:hypothetical protein
LNVCRSALGRARLFVCRLQPRTAARRPPCLRPKAPTGSSTCRVRVRFCRLGCDARSLNFRQRTTTRRGHLRPCLSRWRTGPLRSASRRNQPGRRATVMRMPSSTDGASGPEPGQFGLAAVSLRGPLRDSRYSFIVSVPPCDCLGAERVRDSSWTRNAAPCLPTSRSPSASISCPAADASCRDGDCLPRSRVVALAPCVGGRRAVCQTPSVPSHAGRRGGDHSISVSLTSDEHRTRIDANQRELALAGAHVDALLQERRGGDPVVANILQTVSQLVCSLTSFLGERPERLSTFAAGSDTDVAKVERLHAYPRAVWKYPLLPTCCSDTPPTLFANRRWAAKCVVIQVKLGAASGRRRTSWLL